MKINILHVLLAEDDEDDRFFFKDAFTQIAIEAEITIVSDGVELMNYLKDNASNLPDIVFLDLNMPQKSGMECLAEIKNMPHLKLLPVVILSTSSAVKDIEKSFLLGANMYVKKPHLFNELKIILANVTITNWQVHANERTRDNFVFAS